MSGVIISTTISVLSKALKNFAGEDKTRLVKPSEVTLIIGISDISVDEPSVKHPVKRVEGEPFYRVIKQGKPYLRLRKLKVHPGHAETDEVSFLQVLDAKFDAFQVEALAKPFLMEAFKRLSHEINSSTLNNPGFQAYLNDRLNKEGAEMTPDQREELKTAIIDENEINPADLEIWVITPPRKELPNVSPKDQDLPIAPVPFLYAKGEFVRQLQFEKDIFQMVE